MQVYSMHSHNVKQFKTNRSYAAHWRLIAIIILFMESQNFLFTNLKT